MDATASCGPGRWQFHQSLTSSPAPANDNARDADDEQNGSNTQGRDRASGMEAEQDIRFIEDASNDEKEAKNECQREDPVVWHTVNPFFFVIVRALSAVRRAWFMACSQSESVIVLTGVWDSSRWALYHINFSVTSVVK
jgi:hypothetical protein